MPVRETLEAIDAFDGLVKAAQLAALNSIGLRSDYAWRMRRKEIAKLQSEIESQSRTATQSAAASMGTRSRSAKKSTSR